MTVSTLTNEVRKCHVLAYASLLQLIFFTTIEQGFPFIKVEFTIVCFVGIDLIG